MIIWRSNSDLIWAEISVAEAVRGPCLLPTFPIAGAETYPRDRIGYSTPAISERHFIYASDKSTKIHSLAWTTLVRIR